MTGRDEMMYELDELDGGHEPLQSELCVRDARQ